MDLNLNEKVVWVCGATGAIGREIFAAFAEEGARVCVPSRRADAVEEVASSLDGALAVPVNATDPE